VNTDQVTVTVNPLPNVNAGQDQVICFGSSFLLNASGAITYSWDNGAANNSLFAPAATTTYTVIGTDNNGCFNSDQVTVNVNPLPLVFAGNDVTVCEGESVVLNGSGAIFYIWSNGVTNGAQFVATNTTNYVVTGVDANNCTATDTLVLTVNALPTLSVTPNSQICYGESIILFANSDGVVTWQNNAITNVPFQPTSSATYAVSAVGSNGCVISEQIVITVNPLPIASFLASSFSQGSPNTTFDFTNTSYNSSQVFWDFGDGTGTSTLNNPSYTYPLNSESYSVQLNVVSPFGCVDSIIQLVRVINNSISSEVIIPTGFSPNNDNSNDFWIITGLDEYPNATIAVFNRWGQIVFEGNASNAAWDGRFNGELLPVADYYYILELDNTKKYSGVITIKY
jgi:gliding motility-associated-like protein